MKAQSVTLVTDEHNERVKAEYFEDGNEFREIVSAELEKRYSAGFVSHGLMLSLE